MKRTNYYNNYKDSITILTQYNYDPQGRKTSTALTINKSTPVIIDSLQYNELGQLKTKKLHVNNNVALESIEYKYNARNWLTEAMGINFKQKLFYEKAVNGSTPLYNGTITAQQFGVNVEKEEKYYYDKLNRLTNYTNTNNNTEKIEYADKLGNIKKITRTGESTATITFAYNGNRISQANNKNYLYNVNGSVLNNGEINISNYNELNLPNRISKANTTMYFTYTADGKKIFKNIDNKEVRFYDDGIEFIKARLDSPNVKLEIINTDDGKIQVKGTKYYYQYFLKDHLGNVRAIVSDSNRAVIQRADYYAFGKVRLQGDTAIKYLYNGNEYQAGLDVYDFNARTYDPVTGRFLQVDPNVEDGEQQGFNPYHFSFDNPIRYNDPTGRVPADKDPDPTTKSIAKTNEYKQNALNKITAANNFLKSTVTINGGIKVSGLSAGLKLGPIKLNGDITFGKVDVSANSKNIKQNVSLLNLTGSVGLGSKEANGHIGIGNIENNLSTNSNKSNSSFNLFDKGGEFKKGDVSINNSSELGVNIGFEQASFGVSINFYNLGKAIQNYIEASVEYTKSLINNPIQKK